jgi:transposase
MFVRVKPVGKYRYLQIVESIRVDGKSRQKVLGTLGALEGITGSGKLAGLMQSLSKYTPECLALIVGKSQVQTQSYKIGLVKIFERLWQESGLAEILKNLLKKRGFEFDVERAIFLSVLHRMCAGGSDRQADRWREGYQIEGVEDLKLHHLYRAMAWLGEELDNNELPREEPMMTRVTKDEIEEMLFEQRKDLFSQLSVVYFDTTSLYFEGKGGESLGRRGFSKDHRSDLKQTVVGVTLDDQGEPLTSSIWPGNTTDVKTLIPIANRLQKQFGVNQICLVADRGMISQSTITELEQRQWQYILGVRMRSSLEVRQEILPQLGRVDIKRGLREGFVEVAAERTKTKDPSPLQVKEVIVGTHRYVLCYNPEQARKDAFDRTTLVETLRQKLTHSDKEFIANQGYRQYLKTEGKHFLLDEAKIQQDEFYDGLWVLRTNTRFTPEIVALQYKQLWRVERIFRDSKTLLKTRPIFHKYDATIRGHIFCSFLALVLMKALDRCLEKANLKVEWLDLLRDLKALQVMKIQENQKVFWLRSQLQGCCANVFRAVGVAIPPLLTKGPILQ